MRVLGLCADPGIALDRVKGASLHLLAIWNALGRAGCRVTGVAPWRGAPLPAVAPEVALRPVRLGRADGLPDAVRAAASRDDADVVLERLALGSDAGLAVARALRAPLVVEVNAPLDEEAARFRAAPTADARAAMDRTLRGAALVVVVSSALVEWTRSHGAGDVRVLENGVDVGRFDVLPDMDSGPARVVFVGTFKPWHGVDLLLHACAQAIARGADLSLELIGDGPERLPAEVRAARLGISSRVSFTGTLPPAEVARRMSASHIGVAPAPAGVRPYFSPLKLYEYAAAGLAIVATMEGQAGERFQDGEDALLVPPGDPRLLADALLRLSGDLALRRRLAARARLRAETEFDWSVTAGTLVEWMRASLEMRSGRVS